MEGGIGREEGEASGGALITQWGAHLLHKGWSVAVATWGSVEPPFPSEVTPLSPADPAVWNRDIEQ